MHGPVTRWVDQQDSCGGLYQWPSGPARTDGWRGARQSARRQTPISLEVGNNVALFASTAPARISHQKGIGQRRYASVRISTVRVIWLNGSSIRSNSVGGSRRATTNLLPTSWPSSSSRQFGSGCALMSPRPNTTLADFCERRIPKSLFL